MPKFIITEITNYEIEADSIQELRTYYHNVGLDGGKYQYELTDGSVTFAPIEEVRHCLLPKCPCAKHSCSNSDDYVAEGFHCEDCFRDCIEIQEN